MHTANLLRPVLVLTFGAGLLFSAEPPDAWRASFAEPPLEYHAMPLWYWNGKLDSDELRRQIEASRDRSGFGGVGVAPNEQGKTSKGVISPATDPVYLSDGYFRYYGETLETLRRLGMKAIFYDDIFFPSGSAGGKMKQLFPDDTTRRLDKFEQEVTGPKAWEAKLPVGLFQGAVAMNTQTLERRDLSPLAKDGVLRWNVPAGTWKLMLFTCVAGNDFVDYLSPQSIDKFFSITYDEYYKRFARYFGPSIFTTFFDDVTLRYTDGHRTWTPAFNEKFQKRYGFSPVPYYPALWYDIGPQTSAARVALFDFRAELMAEGYPRKVNEWARAHGIQSSGHAMGQYKEQPAFMAGDNIKFYRHSDIPMMDVIHFYGHGRSGLVLPSSASYTYDRPLTAVEIFGDFTPDVPMMYRATMESFARGANFIIPHAMWYDNATVRIQPQFSYQNPEIADALAGYNEWVARASLLLRGGRHIAEIGMLYPVAAVEAYARFDPPKDVHPGDFVPPETDLHMLSDLLTGAVRRDFTVLHPEILDGRCQIRGATLHLDNAVNYEDYRVLLIPAGRVIYWSNLQKIKQYFDAGGKVVATTRLPSQSAEFGHDADVVRVVKEMFGVEPVYPPAAKVVVKNANKAGGKAFFVPDLNAATLAAVLEEAAPGADVHVEAAGPAVAKDKGMLSYLHRIKDGRNIYYFANSSDEAVDTPVEFSGKHALESWNPYNGVVTAIETSPVSHGNSAFTRMQLKLPPLTSVFLVSK